MKDSIYILDLNIGTTNLESIKQELISRGWYVIQKHVNNKVKVRIYENLEDYDEDETFVTAEGGTYEFAFLTCLTKMNRYYETHKEV